MSMLMFRNKRGDISKHVGIILVGGVILLTLLAHFVRKGALGLGTFYGVGPELQRLIVQWRRDADFIVTGKIIRIRERINQQRTVRNDPAMSYLILDVEVDNIERERVKIEGGLYPGDKIPVYFGWYSPEGGDQFPSGLKQDYRSGNRVRLFLNYDKYRFGFYSPGAYFTIEYLK